jgi:hypothetical protein
MYGHAYRRNVGCFAFRHAIPTNKGTKAVVVVLLLGQQAKFVDFKDRSGPGM